MSDDMLRRAIEVKERYLEQLLGKANVLSVGVGYRQRGGRLTEEVVLVVNVTRKVPLRQLRPEDVVPPTIEGIPVDVQETGPLRAQ
jgi:hypothetical protein